MTRQIKGKIDAFHDADVSNDIVIFGNPCTMQIILSHFGKVKLTSQSKTINSKYIEQFTGISHYKASQEQREELFSKINRANYETMKNNIKNLSNNDKDISSTNILKFLENFESDDDKWIDKINSKLWFYDYFCIILIASFILSLIS
mgnify:CR=1 FL=1